MICHVSGVTLKYKPDAKQCQEICCDGAGGALTVERECTPKDKCEGIEPDEKQEEDHCPGEEKGTCTCGDDGELCRSVCMPCNRVTVGDVFVHPEQKGRQVKRKTRVAP